MNTTEKFEKAIMSLPKHEADVLLFKLMHICVLHKGKENREEIISERLSFLIPKKTSGKQ